MRRRGRVFGFTLIELLVTVSIIALLAMMVVVQIGSSRTKARIAKSLSDLSTINRGIMLMSSDTGYWPFGCVPRRVNSYELDTPLEAAASGLSSKPLVGMGLANGRCTWNAGAISEWKGPYVQAGALIDPWGVQYYFDPDYLPLGNYSQITTVITSMGPDKVRYTEDDQYFELQDL